MSDTLIVPKDVVLQTITHLQTAGQRRSECVVLWLAKRSTGQVIVSEAYRPMQHAASDIFRIPPQGMKALMAYLGEKGLYIGAQVHSHPQEAFHSRADDAWAIIRHVGAISIVVPYFATGTNVQNFTATSAAFELTTANKWQQIPTTHVSQRIIVK